MSNFHHGVWVPLLLKCGLKNETGDHRYNFHSLRHAAASLFIAYLKWPPQTHSDRPWARQNQHDVLIFMATYSKA